MILAVVLALIGGASIGFFVAKALAARPSANDESPATSNDDDVASLLSSAVDHLEIGVVVAKEPKRVVYRNAAARAFRGTHIGVLVDDNLTSIIDEAGAGRSMARVVELQGPPKTWLAISADTIPGGGGVVATIQDISERVRIDAMRTDFVTNISHELKTPVGAVAVLAEALIDEPDPEVVHRLADHIVEEAHRAVRTIDDLLKLSQIESTRPGDTVVNLTAVVQTAIARGRAVDGGRGVELMALESTDEVLIRGDERQLVSAIGNLVENAVKYSRPGDVVQVRTRVDDNAVEVMVADQGIGIPSRDIDRVFERFYRVDKARSRETGGTGLGLSIVRHVATNHGGEVLVSSQEGEGSTFVLRLPVDLVIRNDRTDRTERTERTEPHGQERGAS
ncbi:MAG TPA: ATP-binding protein [Ilumatobacteraceae bacterium]|nr:ATP-binding protein [Ilumatobacteraceae bacterium]